MEMGGGSSVRRSGVEEQPVESEVRSRERRVKQANDFTAEHTQRKEAAQMESFAGWMNFRTRFSSI